MRRFITILALALSMLTAVVVTGPSVTTAAPNTVRAGTPPSKPTSVRAVAGNESVTLRWRPPTSSGTAPISGYRIQRRTGGTWRTVTTVAASVRRFVIPALTNGTSQRVRIAAVSSAGLGGNVVKTVQLPAALDIAIESGTSNFDGNTACAVTPARRVECWGSNPRGVLGIGFTSPAQISFPVRVKGLRDVAEVGVGSEFACARTRTGQLWCWGSDQYNQLPSHTGDTATPYRVTGLPRVRQLSVGPLHACVVLRDRSVRCFGNNGNGQLGSGNIFSTNEPVTPAVTDVAQVSVGGFHTCAVRRNGELFCWGWNGNFRAFGLDDTDDVTSATKIPGISTARRVAAGDQFTCVLLENGNAKCAGEGSTGQVGTGNNADASTFTDVVDLGTITSIAAGQWSACAIYDDDRLRCWGDNFGAGLGLGDPDIDYMAVPTSVVGLGTVRRVEIGSNNVCVITLTWEARCVGLNETGQLGLGFTSQFEAAWSAPIGFG